MFRDFWDYRYEGSARKFFSQWFRWASHSQLKPIIKVAKMIHNHFENIITYLKHPITHAVTEGLNSKIQSIKAAARGFRSFSNYRTRILFFCGKLNLQPLYCPASQIRKRRSHAKARRHEGNREHFSQEENPKT